MQTEPTILQLESRFDQSERVSIVVHSHPDGDALGGAVALVAYLKWRDPRKDVVIVSPDDYPQTLSFLVRGEKILVASVDPEGVRERIAGSDLLVTLDHNAFGRAGSVIGPAMSSSSAFKLLVDHHLEPSLEDFDLAFTSTDTSSTCEVLYYLMVSLPSLAEGAPLPERMAYGLYVGMTTDTNNFANSTYPSTLMMASALIASGVDRDAILSQLYNSYRENRLRAMSYFLSERKLHITPEGLAYVVFTRDEEAKLGLRDGETEGFVNLPLSLGVVVMSIFLKEDNGFYRVSIRSKHPYSASDVATLYFNGGGHVLAAGGKLLIPKDIDRREDAEKYIVEKVAQFLRDSAPALAK